VFVALGILHVIRLRRIAICGLQGFTIFFRIISPTTRLKKKLYEHDLCVSIISTRLDGNIPHSKRI